MSETPAVTGFHCITALFTDEFLPELSGEVARHWPRPLLAVVSTVNRSGRQHAVPRLERLLREGIAFYAFKDGTREYQGTPSIVQCCNWIGRFTYGSLFWRGLHVMLLPGAGRELKLQYDYANEWLVPTWTRPEAPDTSVALATTVGAFWNDCDRQMRLEGLADLEEWARDVLPRRSDDVLFKVDVDQGRVLPTPIGFLKTEDLPRWLPRNTSTAEFLFPYTGTGWNIDIHGQRTNYLIYDFPGLLDELRRVRELARRAGCRMKGPHDYDSKGELWRQADADRVH